MRVTIIVAGSKGDVLPYTGLGAALARNGYEVSVATFPMFESLVTDAGLEFRCVPGDPQGMLDTTEGDPRFTRANMRMAKIAREAVRVIGEPIAEACKDADMILSTAVDIHGYHIAQAMGIPGMGVHLFPLEPTESFPIITWQGRRGLGRNGNRLSAQLPRLAVHATLLSTAVNDFRTKLGLPRIGARAMFREQADGRWPIFCGFSDAVVPRPPDWRDDIKVVGFWWPERPAGWQPDDELVDFVQNGSRPAFVGFDLSQRNDPANVAGTAVAALRDKGYRVVVHGRGDMLGRVEDDVFAVGDIPYSWLFPQMDLLVHRCGPGTVATGLRAAVPAIGIPSGFDRAFWARRLTNTGAAPEHIMARRFTAERFEAALSSVREDDTYREAAAAMSTRIDAEDGAASVVRHVNEVLG